MPERFIDFAASALCAALAGVGALYMEMQSQVSIDQIGPPNGSTQTEQIGSKRLPKPSAKTPAIPAQQASTIGVEQLSEDLEPSADSNEAGLKNTTKPEANLNAQVITAWQQIRERGQTPTPDLIAREIGPDKLAEFLATNPAAGSILATGEEPEPPPKPNDGPVTPEGRP